MHASKSIAHFAYCNPGLKFDNFVLRRLGFFGSSGRAKRRRKMQIRHIAAVGNQILQIEDIIQTTVEAVGPEMITTGRVNQLSGDAHSIARPAHTAFYLPAVLTGFLVLIWGGWSGLVVDFFWSTVALWHATFAVNSLAHHVGKGDLAAPLPDLAPLAEVEMRIADLRQALAAADPAPVTAINPETERERQHETAELLRRLVPSIDQKRLYGPTRPELVLRPSGYRNRPPP